MPNRPAVLAQEVEPVREVVIGAAANLPLTLIGPLTVLEDSTLVVSQPLETRVKALDWTAQRVADVGRAGGGPGEFRFMNGLGSIPGAGFWVWDAGHRRISVFAADGALRKTIPAERTGFSRILLFLPPDTVVVLRRSPEMRAEVVSVGARDGQSGRRWLESGGRRMARVSFTCCGRARQTGAAHQFTIQVRRKDGSVNARSVSYRPIQVDEGDIDRR